MKISSEQLNQVLKTYNRKKETGSMSQVEKKSKGDKLSLSTRAQEVQKAKKALESQSMLREEKVKTLKQAVKTGNYNVSGEEVAEKMLSRTIVDNLV
jgi:negative regulator of flagellin synthesis FlgM